MERVGDSQRITSVVERPRRLWDSADAAEATTRVARPLAAKVENFVCKRDGNLRKEIRTPEKSQDQHHGDGGVTPEAGHREQA